MNKRINKRVTDDVLKYFLDKHRVELQRNENERRKKLKEEYLK